MPERTVNLNLERQSSTATFAISTPLVDAMTLTVNTVEVHTNPMMALPAESVKKGAMKMTSATGKAFHLFIVLFFPLGRVLSPYLTNPIFLFSPHLCQQNRVQRQRDEV